MNASDIMNLVAGFLQFVVAGYALRLNRVLGPKRVGWSLFTAFTLLALLHLVQSAMFSNPDEQSTVTVQVVYALISLLLLTGMVHVETLFKERMRFEQEERRLRAGLEKEVQKKTLYLTKAIEALQSEIDERKLMEAELQAHIELLHASQQPDWPGFDHDMPAPVETRLAKKTEVKTWLIEDFCARSYRATESATVSPKISAPREIVTIAQAEPAV